MTTEEILHSNLTDEQYAAVIDDSRNILCLASAATGKSRTLEYKKCVSVLTPVRIFTCVDFDGTVIFQLPRQRTVFAILSCVGTVRFVFASILLVFRFLR